MTNEEFQRLLKDSSKRITRDISWSQDADHPLFFEFMVRIDSTSQHPLRVYGSYNPYICTLTFTLIHDAHGRIYSLDMGKEHRNPDRTRIGDPHKHSWREGVGARFAYEPQDITAAIDDVPEAWRQFCAEARITHDGAFPPTPRAQQEFRL